MCVRLCTLLRPLLPPFVVLLVTTHSDEQLGKRNFLNQRNGWLRWFTSNARLRLIWQTRKQNRRTLIPTLSYWSHTSKWRPAFPTCQSILDCKGLWLFQLRKRVYVVCERSGTDNVRAPYLNSFRKNKINFKFLPCWSACVYLLPLIFLIILSLFFHLSVSLLILLLALQRQHRQLQQQQKKLSACHFKINLLLVLLVCFARFVHSRRLSYFPISTKHYADCIW